jgi:hypothetical protein
MVSELPHLPILSAFFKNAAPYIRRGWSERTQPQQRSLAVVAMRILLLATPLSWACARRPVALRPRLSTGLPLHAASKPHEVELRKHLVTEDFTSSQGESHGFLLWLKLLYRMHILAIKSLGRRLQKYLENEDEKRRESAQ